MKRIVTVLLFVCCMFAFAACDKGSGGGEAEVIVMTELPASVTAELGERYNIPEVTATKGNKNVPVEVNVKNAAGEEVELQGRGTRFSVTELSGYVMTFTAKDGEEKAEKSVNVTVTDSKGPAITLPPSAYGMTVKKNSTVSVPQASWTDKSGEVTDLGYTVTFGDTEITVTNDTFSANDYGVYTVTYKAKDKFENVTEQSIDIECARSILLADFNDTTKVWADENISEITPEHAVEGNAFKVTCSDWHTVVVYPEYYDLSGFDKLQITIYSTADMDTSDEGFYLLNKRSRLSAGENIITMTKADLDSQYPGGKIPSTQRPDYADKWYLWFQAKSAKSTIYIDNLIGVFDNYTEDTKKPVIDTGKGVGDKIQVSAGRKVEIPAAAAYDNSMESITVQYTVTTKAGDDITERVKAGEYVAAEADEEYKIVYSAADGASNTRKKTITCEVTPKVEIPDLEKEKYFPEDYDMLNDFEGTGVDWNTVEDSFETEHVMNGEKSVRLSTDTNYSLVVMKMLKDGKVLKEWDWQQYEYIQAYVYSDSENAKFYFHNVEYELVPGPNVLKITSAKILEEIASATNTYDSTGGFYFQLSTGTVFVDAIIGVYPDGYDHTQTPPVEEIEVPDSVKNYYPSGGGTRYDVLQDFETAAAIDTYFFGDSKGLTAEHALKGNAYNIAAASADWAKLPLTIKKDGKVLTEEDWKAYESFKLYIYSDTACTFAFLSKIYDLKEGYNVVEISSADIWAQISSNAECYSETGAFWCQVNGVNVNLWFDELIGIYPAQ